MDKAGWREGSESMDSVLAFTLNFLWSIRKYEFNFAIFWKSIICKGRRKNKNRPSIPKKGLHKKLSSRKG